MREGMEHCQRYGIRWRRWDIVRVVVHEGVHCNENPIYVFPEKELRGLSPNFHIHTSVSDLYIPRIGPHIFLQQNRQTH